MPTAICLTPDRRFFGPALCVASQIIACGLPDEADLFLVCEETDVWPRFEEIDETIRKRLKLAVTSFDDVTRKLPSNNNGEHAITRRLFLDRVLPAQYDRIIPVDSDMMIVNEGLAPLISLDLEGAVLAAATDMISYMDFGGHLAEEFQAYRASLGMTPDTLYFNNGLTVIDRALWTKAEMGERTLRFIAANPKLCLRFEQSALNALLKGGFVRLSPRFNFMGDFMSLDLEEEIRPNVYHFVNRPKPWQRGWVGDPRYAHAFRDWFAISPWPDFPDVEPVDNHYEPVNQDFRRRLWSFLETQHFADGWQPQMSA
ncbi:glycosyltransferase family 8 protein [Taklimakanibacter deserti]|uniref:glycosyltransferase family 8 protein n=1 Tax=Taklimakanibacter deserti TaxID=2267839 RepID=UPI0013C45423